MKAFTRKEMRALILKEKGEPSEEKVLDLLMAFQDAHRSAYKRGYQDGLKQREVPSEL